MATTNGTDGVRATVENVGYIGLGNAGFSMSSNIPKKGFNLVVHDQDQAKVKKAVSEWKNTTSGSDDPSAFSKCSVIVTMLPNGKIVRDVLLGSKGIAPSLKPGTIIVDTSSSSPFDTISLGKELAEHQLHLIDSPITQTYMHATDDGRSTLMVGSDSPERYEIVKPVLECMGSYIFHMGPLGAGHAMKTLNNYVMASSLVALNDSLVTGQKYGLDPQTMIDCLNVGTGVNFPTMDTVRRDTLTRNFNSGFGLALLVKDLGITEDFMKHSQFETKLPGLLRGYLQHGIDVVGPERGQTCDHTESIRGWEERCGGVELKKTDKVSEIPTEDFEHRLKGLNRK